MDVGVYSYPHGDSLLIDKIVNEFLSQGKFDKLRKECMSDADTKPAYQNLQQRVENTVTQFLRKQVWRPDLNKNQLRDSLRKHILESKFFDAGINRIVDQVVNPNLLATVFLPEVEEVVYNYLSIPRPSDRSQKKEPSDDKYRSSGREYEYRTSHVHERQEKIERSDGDGDHRQENHLGDENHKLKETVDRKLSRDFDFSSEPVKMEADEERVKQEPEEMLEFEFPGPSDESQESLNRMAAEGLRIGEMEGAGVPDSDESAPLEINEKSMSESRDSEDSIMNQMSPISQGRLTPELEEEEEVVLDRRVQEPVEVKQEERAAEKGEGKVKEKKPMTFVGRIPKIKREDSESSKSSKAKEKLDVKVVYSSDESDSSKSYGRSDSDEKRRKNEKGNEKEERKQDDTEKRVREKSGREKSRDRHKEERRDRSRDRHKKSSSSSSSSQRERSSGHHKSSHRHRESKSRRKEDEKKKSKSTDDHGKEKMKKEDRRSTDRDSNERERERSSGSRGQGESRKREKEQQKTEEGKRESSQKGEEEMEREGGAFGLPGEAEGSSENSENFTFNFQELSQTGALSKIEFAKLTDDFYVKFNSTGFRYFEEWEKTKLDCEEEFKEFVDEAENDLSLLSDDESEFEFEIVFGEENRKTIRNLLKGLGNFPRSLMFDPATAEFYGWTDNESFDRFRRKTEKRERKRSDKKETVESIKENIDRGEKTRALHMKLLSKYRRKALTMGKPRRRHRRPGSWGIKEQNENPSVSRKRFFNDKSEPFFPSRVPILPGCNLVESGNSSVPESMNGVNMFPNEEVRLPDSPEENEDWPEERKTGGGGKTDVGNGRETNLPKSLPLNLPPSPDSDDINNGITPKDVTAYRKRINKETEGMGTPKKQTRRSYSQKYDSQDLYKPRLMLNSSRTRGKERDAIRIDSPISR